MNQLQAKADDAKCEGIGCAYKQSCGRYLRPSAGETQAWASWYAIAEDDCAAFETTIKPLHVNHGETL